MKRYFPLFLVPLALYSSLCAEDLVPLKLELPKPLFAGTPRPIQISNLEPKLFGRRPDLMVPAGTTLLSKGKDVTASDALPVLGELACVTDGDKSGTDGAFVELGPGLQWVQIDLGSSAKLAAIVIWHFHSQARVYHDVIVQVSDDRDFKQGVKTLFNNDENDSAKQGRGKDLSYIETNAGKLIDTHGAVGRYVRLFCNGNTSDELNHYCEVEVFGQPGG